MKDINSDNPPEPWYFSWMRATPEEFRKMHEDYLASEEMPDVVAYLQEVKRALEEQARKAENWKDR